LGEGEQERKISLGNKEKWYKVKGGKKELKIKN
jgi:hypothetical protein